MIHLFIVNSFLLHKTLIDQCGVDSLKKNDSKEWLIYHSRDLLPSWTLLNMPREAKKSWFCVNIAYEQG